MSDWRPCSTCSGLAQARLPGQGPTTSAIGSVRGHPRAWPATKGSRGSGASVGRVVLTSIRPTEARHCRRYSLRPVPIDLGTAARPPSTSLGSPRPRLPRLASGPARKPSRTPRANGLDSCSCCMNSPTCVARRRLDDWVRALRGCASGGGAGRSRDSRLATHRGPGARSSSRIGSGRW